MSIKKLFSSTDKSRNYLADTNQKDAFTDVESKRNVEALSEKQDTFVPQVDYAKPENFVKYGSAYLYYESAVDRILDFYPYDGSGAELNEFYNKSLDIEKYIFNDLYPRTHGYINIANAEDGGWGTADTAPAAANFYYGAPDGQEYITFKGGPGTASGDTYAALSPNPMSSKFQYSNIYDTDIYQTEGLPSDYGKGTRESNLKSNFDTGVTLEFWLTTGSANTLNISTQTQKQVIADIWNNNASTAHDYGRLTLGLGTGSGGVLGMRFNNAGTTGDNMHSEITITSAGEVTKTYKIVKCTGAGCAGVANADGKIQVAGAGSTYGVTGALAGALYSAKDLVVEFKRSINGSAGHNGGSTDSVFKVVTTATDAYIQLTQAASGSDGNTAVSFTETFRGDCSAPGGGGTGSLPFAPSSSFEGGGGPLMLTVQSGTTTGIFEQNIGGGINWDTFASWHHYAVTIFNSGSDLGYDFYLDGLYKTSSVFTGQALGELPSKDMMGRLGALITPPKDTSAAAGSGKLTGSMDEFRFWKARRTAKEVGRHWNTQVRGGVNSDISNATLGLYYKFNEGIVGDSNIDDIVLDYGGRICNGVWTGYGANSRNVGSAIISASAAATEYRDPIIRSNHPGVSTLRTDLLSTGSNYDLNNNNSILNLLPGWVIDDVESDSTQDLRILSHIVGAYFDKLYLQISAIEKFKHASYTSSSYTALPFANHLPQSLGLYMPELFVDADIIEKFLNRDDTSFFDGSLEEAKNLIYLNLYNNLTQIFKSKGTEKSVRNILRCFNLDQSLIRMNVYANDTTYELKNNLKQTFVNRSALNLNEGDNIGGVVYQAVSQSSNGDAQGYIWGSQGLGSVPAGSGSDYAYGFTLEADVNFPSFFSAKDKFNRDFYTASLFGMYTVDTGSADSKTGVNTGWVSNYTDHGVAMQPDFANLQVSAIRPSPGSKNVYFHLTSSNYPTYIPYMVSPMFAEVYDNTEWNFSVRLKPSNYPLSTYNVTGSQWFNYDVVFRGVQTELGTVINSFETSSTLTATQGREIIGSAKRVYAGARRTNITGALLNQSDVRIDSVRYWSKYLDNDSLNQHAYDFENHGISASYQSISPLDPNSTGSTDGSLLNLYTLALNWDFANVTGSDATGQFNVTDMSSGSALIRDNFGWLGNLAGYQHSGYGYGFGTSSTTVVDTRPLNSYKFINPELAISDDAVQILTNDDVVFGFTETVPNYVYTLEKSMYNAISEEMLQFFAGIIDFNNIIGHPVNRYRDRYKDLEKLREVFFRRVTTTSHVEKFIDYYKWFDDAISALIGQLVPASSDFTADVYNTIESHVLERNKYQTKFPTIEARQPDLDSSIAGDYGGVSIGMTSPPAASPRPTYKHEFFWRKVADRASAEISSGDATIDRQRNKVRDVQWSSPRLSSSLPVFSEVDGTTYTRDTFARKNSQAVLDMKMEPPKKPIKGGVNFTDDKNIAFTYNSLYPAGPINREAGVFVPENVLVAFTDDMVGLKETIDEGLNTHPNRKLKRHMTVLHGRDFQDGLGYTTTKASYSFPFNVLSSSVTTGYSATVNEKASASMNIVNLHNDVYGPDMEVPMQGPFTNYAVGGHQSRHVSLNTGSDTYTNRPEAWKLLLGKCSITTGAIGMAGADYPWPEANDEDFTPYPMTGALKAVYYRDMTAKRPVNIKNILNSTGSNSISSGTSVPGNYQHNYQVVNSVGAHTNPRNFVENQPTIPSQVVWTAASSSVPTNIRTFWNTRRQTREHFKWVGEYSTSYLTSATNASIIVGRFAAPGGIEVMSYGYLDIRASEFSVYNGLNYRNLSVIKPSQGATSSFYQPVGSGTSGIRVYDVIGRDYGLRSHMARHSARFGRDSLFVTSSGDLPGASYDQYPAMFKNNRNRRVRLKITNTGDIFNPNSVSVASSSMFDNFSIGHMIPRADRQYSWVTASLAAGNNHIRYYGRAPTTGLTEGMYSSSADGWVAYFDYVTASQVVDKDNATFNQPTYHLNTLIVDPITSSTNTMGFPSTSPLLAYYNSELGGNNQVTVGEISDGLLNLVLTHRGSTFGWNWKKARQGMESPIILRENRNNEISVLNRDGDLDKYRLAPVSIRGRPAYVNITAPTSSEDTEAGSGLESNDVTFKVSDNNSKIFFNETNLDNLQDLGSSADIYTPLEQIYDIANNSADYNLTWILYSQNVFPAMRNEFLSSSTGRLNYTSSFWRNSREDRLFGYNVIRDPRTNSFGVTGLSASIWPLDPPNDFNTRASAPSAVPYAKDGLLTASAAGELQNTYFSYVRGVPATAPVNIKMLKALRPGGLYARKHILPSPRTVVSPSGMEIHETGSVPTGSSFIYFGTDNKAVDMFAGEANWQAGTDAGIVVKTGSTSVFSASPSEPWFDEYEDYIFELNNIAKGYAIVPEFRISEHVEDYVKYGLLNDDKQDTFEIPGTHINSTTSSFYKDYSNSEFLKGFAQVHDDSLLNAKEIKLVCSASIRFHPYEGFYPAQRTLDLVSQFSRSYADGLVGYAPAIAAGKFTSITSTQMKGDFGGVARPLMDALYSPGLLYNTMKSGMAVDYPIVTDETKIKKAFYGTAVSELSDSWALAPRFTVGLGANATGYRGGEYWDARLPFETLLEPEKHISNVPFYDVESHPSMSINATASFNGQSVDNIYTLMADNFFGEVGNFFLKDSSYTTLKSNTVKSDLRFERGSVYGARLKLYRSTEGPRTYQYESSSLGKYQGSFDANNTGFGRFGALLFSGSDVGVKAVNNFQSGSEFPIPQDPQKNPEFRENFTMYSRPTAFGPSISGRPSGSDAYGSELSGTLDSFNGCNWSFTPPYYNGEAWVDFIFRPRSNTSYDLEAILAETSASFWRVDPGYDTGSAVTPSTLLIKTYNPQDTLDAGNATLAQNQIYDGKNVNLNAMQISASLNLFGVEDVQEQEVDKFGNEIKTINKSVGKRWVIQPKFETPHMNFNDKGIRPITASEGTITMPSNYGSGSVPRGMWHQFGVMPEDANKGIFMEFGDIPNNWLKYHYDVISNDSIYNNLDAATTGQTLYKNMKSLGNVVGFNRAESKVRLGELAEKQTLKEAIVAIPYVVEAGDVTGESGVENKKLFEIAQERYDAALSAAEGSDAGDSLEVAGESIRKLVQKMDQYILPPQFDFLNNSDVSPIVMYFFEFSYDLDKDDLSYIWQNTAPRNYKKMSLTAQSTAHSLDDSELLSADDIIGNENLRWMVFKVKQKSQQSYYDLVAAQAGEGDAKSVAKSAGYQAKFNWPYDYVSFVETIKMDVEVQFHNPSRASGSMGGGGGY